MHKRHIPDKLIELLSQSAHVAPADYIRRSINDDDTCLSELQSRVLDALGVEIHQGAKNVCEKVPLGELCRSFGTNEQTHVATFRLSRSGAAVNLEMDIYFDISPIRGADEIKAFDKNIIRALSPSGKSLCDDDLETLARYQLEDQHGALRVPPTGHLTMSIGCKTPREYKESRASTLDLAIRVFGDEPSDWATRITYEWSAGLISGPSAHVTFSSDEMMMKTTDLFGDDLIGSFESNLALLKDGCLTNPARIPDLKLVQRTAPIAIQIMENLQSDPPDVGPEELV